MDRTILGFRGYSGGCGLGEGRKRGPSRWGGGSASSAPSWREAKARAGPVTSARKRTAGRVAQHAPPTGARTPSPASCRHELALLPPAGPRATATPDSPRVPHPESEVSATAPCAEGKTEALGTREWEEETSMQMKR